MRAEVVEKVCEYLVYKERYKATKGEIPDFKERVKPEIALELCVAAPSPLRLSLSSSESVSLTCLRTRRLMASDYLEC